MQYAHIADYARVVTVNISEYPYIVPIAMAELGRGDEALSLLRELEHKVPTRIRDFIVRNKQRALHKLLRDRKHLLSNLPGRERVCRDTTCR